MEIPSHLAAIFCINFPQKTPTTIFLILNVLVYYQGLGKFCKMPFFTLKSSAGVISIFKALYMYQHMTSELKRHFIHKLFFIITTNFCMVLYFILMSYFQHLAVLLCQNKYFVTSGSWGSPPVTIKLKSFSYQHCKYVTVDLTAVPWKTENKIIGRRLYNFSGQTFSLVMENILGNKYGWLLLFDIADEHQLKRL